MPYQILTADQSSKVSPVKIASYYEVMIKVSGFSVQVSASMFLFPDTRHLTPDT
jgi:hypothetical protein